MKPSPYEPRLSEVLIHAVCNYPDDPETLEAVLTLPPEAILNSSHRKLWALIRQVAQESGSLDPSALFLAIQKADCREDDRGMMRAIVIDAPISMAMRSDIRHAVREIREANLRSNMAKRLHRIQDGLMDLTEPVQDIVKNATEVLQELQAEGGASRIEDSDFLDEVDRFGDQKPLMENPHRAQMVRFGIPALDHALIAGPGSLGVVAAKTSAGKTALAIQALLATHKAGLKPAIFSLEMSDDELAARLIANHLDLDSWDVLRGAVDFRGTEIHQLRQIAHGIRKVSKIPARAFDAVAAKIRQMRALRGTDVVFVDYFTLLNPPDLKNRSASVAFQLGEMSKGFKALAVDLGISIVLLSQFNRGVEDGQRPTLENLRETGQLEQDANWILMLWTEGKDYEPSAPRVVNMELQKNRGGKRWIKAQSLFHPASGRFRERETQPSSPATRLGLSADK